MQRFVSNILLILLERGFSQARRSGDLGTHRGLWSDGPSFCWVTHSRGNAGWVGTTDVLVCIWVDRFLRRISVRRQGSNEAYGVYNWRRWALVHYGTPGHIMVGVSGPRADWTEAILRSGTCVRVLPLTSWNGVIWCKWDLGNEVWQ
jgi:hypothetical protein